MAESKSVTVIPLNSSNYSTWKIQCKMALIKDGLWGIVSGAETAPDGAAEQAKFALRKDRALATIVLAVNPSLLYLIGADPKDPAVVWKVFADQFQRNTWANKLELKRKLFSLRLADGGSVQDHIKAMTEIFDALSVMDEPVKEEDRVVYLLASLPECYSVLVTALEANPEVPALAVVTERLLHEESKIKSRTAETSQEEALTARFKRFTHVTCHFCHKPGHIRRDCFEYAKVKGQVRPLQDKRKPKTGAAFKVTISADDEVSSDCDSTGLVVQHALSADANCHDRWILDSGATGHMCNSEHQFVKLQTLSNPLTITLGDGGTLQAGGRGEVVLRVKLPHGKIEECTLHNVLYVPDLAFNLLSVPAAARKNKVTTFSALKCEIKDAKGRLVASGHREGSLYYLDCDGAKQQAHSTRSQDSTTWHRRFGHLGMGSLRSLVKDDMVNGLNFDCSQELGFCESCTEGKTHRLPFQERTSMRAKQPLELIHSDVCGKVGTKSLSGGEYFVTFVDDHTHYVWVYILKRKSEVYQRFREWKVLVEKATGRKVKTLRSDNGGEYTSAEFSSYLRDEGIRHEFTIPHTPQQNGVSERLNRTLIECVRAMLADSTLPHRFWAEALSTAVYLRNRSPTKALQGITPFEAWHGTKPDVSSLRIFGCSAYAHVPKTERHKLDSKTRKCVLLGYCEQQKGYRLYDLSRDKVFSSRDVLFNEASVPGIQKEQKENGVEFQLQEPVAENSAIPERVEETVEENPAIPNSTGSEEPEQIDSGTDRTAEVSQREDSTTLDPPPVRKSTRVRRERDWYGFVAADEESDPSSVAEALSSHVKSKWEEAMDREMESLHSNEVWELVEPPPDRKIVGSKWIFRKKMDANGTVNRYKARLVAQGCSQRFGLDYEETFSPVVCFESVRSVIGLGAHHKLQLHQMDVTTAFLHGELSEEVYMEQPEGYIVPGQEHLVCRLKRSIYGLKQAPRCWNYALDNRLKEMGFKQTSSDPCLYVSSDANGDVFIIAVYVDDIILGGRSEAKMRDVKKELSQNFKMKDLGPLHHFLGVTVVQDQTAGSIWLGQPSYTEKLLQKFGMSDCKPVKTPVNPDVKLTQCEHDDDVCDQKTYQAMVGSLLYLSTRTRPDLAYAVGSVARYCAKPTKEHWMGVKRILRYLKGTVDFGLLYSREASPDCVGYCDADWAGDVGDRKSTSGYVFLQGGAAITWKSSKQSCVALSTAEAEYVALSAAAQEAIWLQQLTSDLLNKNIRETTIHEDNQSAMCMAKNQQSHRRTKHIEIKYHFIRDLVEAGRIKLTYCPSEDMIADMLTKGLPIAQFEKLRALTGMCEHSRRE